MHKLPMVLILLVSFFIVFSGGELILNPFATSLYFLLGYSIYKDSNFLNFLIFNWKKYMIIGLIVSCLFLIFENLLYLDFQYKLPPQELDELHDLIWLINQPIKVTGAILKDVNSDKTQKIECSGVFIAIGHQPNTLLFKDFLGLFFSNLDFSILISEGFDFDISTISLTFFSTFCFAEMIIFSALS